MALLNCHECGKYVSTDAKSCPSCGARIKAPKRKSRAGMLLVALIAIVGGFAALHGGDPAAASASARAATPTAQQAARDREATQSQVLAAAGANVLKQGAKDRNSFELVSVAVHPGLVACYEYRARNSFNAMLDGAAVLVDKKMLIQERDGNSFVKAWNERCTKADGYDVTSAMPALMRLTQ